MLAPRRTKRVLSQRYGQTTLREDALRIFGVTGRRGAAVPVDVGPARGQPDQQSGAGEWGTYPDVGLGIGYDLPLSRLALKHTAVPSFSGKKPDFPTWTRDARYYTYLLLRSTWCV